MTTTWRTLAAGLLLAACGAGHLHAVELTVSRDALQRTLIKQLFSGPSARYYIKGNPQTPCYTYVQDPQIQFLQGRIVVQMKTFSKLGKQFGNSCLGINVATPAAVSLMPDGQGETLGFKDARVDSVSNVKEVSFLLAPFLSRQIPSSMRVNAADLLRKALAGSTASSGYYVALDRLQIRAIQVQGDLLVLDADGNIVVK
jgi:hypothetical protein